MIVKREASPDDVRMGVVSTAEDTKEADEDRSADAIDTFDITEPVVEAAETSIVIEVVESYNVIDLPENSDVAEGIVGVINVSSIESAMATESGVGGVVNRVIDDTDVAVDSVVGDADGRNDREGQKIEQSTHSYTPPGTPSMVPVFLNHEMLLTPLSAAHQKLD